MAYLDGRANQEQQQKQKMKQQHSTPPGGVAFKPLDRRRRTANLVWDCDFEANWIDGVDPAYVMPVPIKEMNETGVYDPAHPEQYCKQECLASATVCTGFWIFEDSSVPGQGVQKCGLFTSDMNQGTKEIKHGTSGGLLCLHVGKNFDCTLDKNSISPGPEMRNDFDLLEPPKDGSVTKPDDALNKQADDALGWCKLKCNAKSCSTFWFHRQPFTNPNGQPGEKWTCGMYVNAVDDSLRIVEADTGVSGCICDTV